VKLNEFARLGVNHHLLYADAIINPAEHLRTLRIALADPRFDVVDMWYPWEIKDSLLPAVAESGKSICYNMGNRAGQRSLAPASIDRELRSYSLGVYLDELERAQLCGAERIITNSGPNDLEHREQCFDYLVEFYVELCRHAEGLLVMIEPTDFDTSKRKLVGSSAEAVGICRRVHGAGCPNMASMIDLCHVPLMHETIPTAFADTGDYLGHIHLGTCVVDRGSPYFGDKHPGIGIPGGVYGIEDFADVFRVGLSRGYFSQRERGWISIEMRALPGKSSEESLDIYYDAVCRAWEVRGIGAARGPDSDRQ
jgi:sugar phosphate isomerase/epimerase